MIYHTSNKHNFLEEVAQFAIESFSSDFSKLKIILPTGLICNEIQKLLITKLCSNSSIILPQIIPLNALMPANEEAFNVPYNQIDVISTLEEKILLSSIINSYTPLNYSILQSSKLAPMLANLFFDFEVNNITLSELKKLPILDQAEHWNRIYDFLFYASDHWSQAVQGLNKMTRAEYQKMIFTSELQRLTQNIDQNLLLSGIVGDNLIINEFITNASLLKNVDIILPPATHLVIESIKRDTKCNNHNKKSDIPKIAAYNSEDGLYRIYKLLISLDYDKHIIASLGSVKPQLFDYFISNNRSHSDIALEYHDNISYIEFDNIFHEAEYVAIKCKEFLKLNNKAKIAIIAHNQSSKEQYSVFLDKYQIQYHDIFGHDLLTQYPISLLVLVAEIICCKFRIHTLFTILSHPLIDSKNAQDLKNLIRKHNRFASSFESITQLIEQQADANLQQYYDNLQVALRYKITDLNFTSILQTTVNATESLIPNLWASCHDIALSLQQIYQINWQYILCNIEHFPELLKSIITGGRISDPNSNAQIIMCRPGDILYINYDLIIFTNLNDTIYPANIHNNPWINLQMQDTLGDISKRSNIGNELYAFYMILQNKHVILTRAKKHNKQMLPSPFILRLQSILGHRLRSKVAQISPSNSDLMENQMQYNYIEDEFINSPIFPSRLSATDIETLIRSPYNFYTKKILHLKKLDEISDQPSLSEFGNFCHLVIEEYTKNFHIYLVQLRDQAEDLNKEYYANTDNMECKKAIFLYIGKCMLSQNVAPEWSKNAWLVKLSMISDEFIEFDDINRANSSRIYSEIKGTMTLNILNHNIDIIAIADRISIDQQNIATIFDYKTGAIPTKKDIFSGLSPQLIVESMILSENGFDIASNLVKRLVYIKINSNKPYLKVTEFTISPQELDDHKNGLISLLHHYISTKQFAIKPNLLKYDDYMHLSRRRNL